MKKLLALLFCILFAVACQTYPAPVAAPSSAALVERLNSETVALVRVDDEGQVHPFCTGVWVSADKILTAGHCAENSETFLVAASETAPLKLAIRDRISLEKDLALIQLIGVPPLHDTASLAVFDPVQGDELHFIGQTMGLWFSYGHGYVSAYRGQDFEGPEPIKGPFMQVVSTGVWKGNSGGGAFNTHGELVGVCSFGPRQVDFMHFFVPLSTIRTFLTGVQ